MTKDTEPGVSGTACSARTAACHRLLLFFLLPFAPLILAPLPPLTGPPLVRAFQLA